MIDINELRRKANSTDIVDHIDLHANIRPLLSELLDRLEAAEKERDNANAAAVGVALKAEKLEAERDALRAKIEAMERQEPICRAEDLKHAELLLPMLGLKPENHLYALPGAQSAQSVPDGWKIVPVEPTSEMLDKGSDQSYGYVSIALDVWVAMLAAAPETKP